MAEQRTLGVPTLRSLPLSPNVEGMLDATQVHQAVEYLRNETERWLRQLYNDLDKIVGVRGEPTFESDVNSNGHRIKSLGKSITDTDAQTRGQCLHLDSGETVFDAGGRSIVNVPIANQDSQAVPLTQLTNFDSGRVGGINSLELLQRNGSVALTADWDAGSFEIRAETFESDIVTGTAPLAVASTTVVTNLNADTVDGAGYAEGTFTATGTGFTVNPTGTARYILFGNMVVLFLPLLTGTSNALTFTITGIPAAIQPVQTAEFPARIVDNTVPAYGSLGQATGAPSILTVFPDAGKNNWTSSGVKTLTATWLAYALLS